MHKNTFREHLEKIAANANHNCIFSNLNCKKKLNNYSLRQSVVHGFGFFRLEINAMMLQYRRKQHTQIMKIWNRTVQTLRAAKIFFNEIYRFRLNFTFKWYSCAVGWSSKITWEYSYNLYTFEDFSVVWKTLEIEKMVMISLWQNDY